jgi:hypothetical protein
MAFGPAPARNPASSQKPSNGAPFNSKRKSSPAVKTGKTSSSFPGEMVPGLTIDDIEAHISAEQAQADECRARCHYLEKAIATAEAEAAQYHTRIANAEASSAGGSSQDVQQILRCVLEVMQPMREKLMAKAAAGALSDQESIAYVALTGWNQKACSSVSDEGQSSTPLHRRQVRSVSPPQVASLPASQCPTPQPYPQVERRESSSVSSGHVSLQPVPAECTASTVNRRDSRGLQTMPDDMPNVIVADFGMQNSAGPTVHGSSDAAFVTAAATKIIDRKGPREGQEVTVRQETAQHKVHVPPTTMPDDDMPELKVKQPASRQPKNQRPQQIPTPMADLKKQLDQDFEARNTASVYSEQPKQVEQAEETKQITEEQLGSGSKASSSQSALKDRAQTVREKMLARKRERRKSEELAEPPAVTTTTEVSSQDGKSADEAPVEKETEIKQKRRESLKLVRQQWQEKQKKKQQDKMQAQPEKSRQAGSENDRSENEDVLEEPQSLMAKIMQEYKSSCEQGHQAVTLHPAQLEVEVPQVDVSERRNSKHSVLNQEQEVLGQHVGQWAEQKQKLLQHEDEARKHRPSLDELFPTDTHVEEAVQHQTKCSERRPSNASFCSLASDSSMNRAEKRRPSIEPCHMPLSMIVGTYASEDCDSITVKPNGAVFFDVEDMGVVVAHAPDGTPTLRPRGKESALASELDYAFRLLKHTETDLVWRDEVDPSAPYVQWKRAIGS